MVFILFWFLHSKFTPTSFLATLDNTMSGPECPLVAVLTSFFFKCGKAKFAAQLRTNFFYQLDNNLRHTINLRYKDKIGL